MDGFAAIIIVLAALAGFFLLFFFIDWFAKRGAKANRIKLVPSLQKSSAPEPEVEIVPLEAVPAEPVQEVSPLKESSKREEKKSEPASARSRMYNRRARMLEYYDKKYKSRTIEFGGNSFEEPRDNSPAMVVDGIEITKEDIKKLTALHGLFARKEAD